MRNKIQTVLAGFLTAWLTCLPAAAWSHANAYGGHSSGTAGEGGTHTNAYGGSTSPRVRPGHRAHQHIRRLDRAQLLRRNEPPRNVYGGTTTGAYGAGAYHTTPLRRDRLPSADLLRRRVLPPAGGLLPVPVSHPADDGRRRNQPPPCGSCGWAVAGAAMAGAAVGAAAASSSAQASSAAFSYLVGLMPPDRRARRPRRRTPTRPASRAGASIATAHPSGTVRLRGVRRAPSTRPSTERRTWWRTESGTSRVPAPTGSSIPWSRRRSLSGPTCWRLHEAAHALIARPARPSDLPFASRLRSSFTEPSWTDRRDEPDVDQPARLRLRLRRRALLGIAPALASCRSST